MSDSNHTHGRPRRSVRSAPITADFRADRRTALEFLNACVEAEIGGFGEILSYIDGNRSRTRRLLEDILSLEEEHAQGLLGILQVHRAAIVQEAGARKEDPQG